MREFKMIRRIFTALMLLVLALVLVSPLLESNEAISDPQLQIRSYKIHSATIGGETVDTCRSVSSSASETPRQSLSFLRC
jgi:hypothetical protein